MARPYRNLGFFFLLLFALVLAGFTPRIPGTAFFGYFTEVARGAPVPAVIHVHAAVAAGWFVLLIVQAFLVRADRTRAHRWLGWGSLLVVAALYATAVPVMKHAFESALLRMPRDTALSMLVQPVSGLALFGVMYALALAFRRRRLVHVAFLVGASLAAATPGLARLGLHVVGGLPGIGVVLLLIYATLVVFLLHATLRLRQPVMRSPWLVVIALFLCAHTFDFVVGGTDAWRAVAGRLVAVW